MRLLRDPSLSIILAVLVLVPLLLYIPSLGNGFVNWDDAALITDNPWIRGFTWPNIRHAFTSYDPELYVPLTLVSYQLTWLIGGVTPLFYHAGNLLLHIANGILVFGIALQLTKRRDVAAATALLFAVHPLHTEAVAWASARKDVLSTLFLFMALWSFLRFRATELRKWHALSVIAFALGLLSKVSILTAPFVLIAIDWLQGRVPFRKAVTDAAPFFALSVIFGVISIFGKMSQSALVQAKILIGIRALGFLLQKLLLPWGLTALYPYTQPISLFTPDIFFSAIVVIAITALCIWLACRAPESRRTTGAWPLFAWIVFVFLILPSFTNLTKGKNYLLDVYVTSDRYAYAASLGPLLLAGLLFAYAHERLSNAAHKGAAYCAPTILTGVTIIFCILAYRQSLTWKDSETFFRHMLTVSPNSYIAHQNLGTILGRRGDFDGALEEYKAVLHIRPDGETYYDIGQILEHDGNIPVAIEAYKEAVKVSGDKDAAARLKALTGSEE